MKFRNCVLLVGTALSLVAHATSGVAQDRPLRHYDVPAQELKYALRAVSRDGGYQLIADSAALRGLQSRALSGDFTVDDAIRALLSGTELSFEIKDRTIFVRGRSEPSRDAAASAAVSSEIVVTGTHIAGAQVASPVITLSADKIREAGQNTIGEAVRDLPQNFSGGQNPGVAGGGDQGGNQNLNSSSSINLRGLGADATLTLINGHRVAYDGLHQGVDIDQIPVAALDRIEIVPDGASALYGSDAVGGVANIILKHDFQGVTVGARLGAATTGGDEEQQYDVTAGQVWKTGGIMATFDVRRTTAVDAGQRDITHSLNPDETLFPWVHQYGGLVTAHQDLSEHLHFSIDAIYSHRTTSIDIITNSVGPITDGGAREPANERSYSITPALSVDVGRTWKASLTATYGIDNTDGTTISYFGAPSETDYGYHNRIIDVEGTAEGALIALPGGNVRLAVGGGYRSNRFISSFSSVSHGEILSSSSEARSRSSYYGFAELNLPIVSESNSFAAVYGLSATAAVRYEDYPGSARIATPKIGLIYAPSPDITFKGSWGKSFKTPTLYQELQDQSAVVELASALGAKNAPADATAIFYSGGNPELKPERATSWSATVDIHARALPGFKLEASYFHVNYRDRILAPIQSTFGLLSNPVYQDLINYSPSSDYLDMIVARTPGSFFNYSGSPYDPSKVYAVVDDRNVNIARQTIDGVDLDSSYRFAISVYGTLTLSAAASYLHSSQQRTPLFPSAPLAGTIFFPPSWRAHGGILWQYDGLAVATNINYIAGVTDNRAEPIYHIRGIAPVDLVITQHIRSDRPALNGIELALTVRNIQNVMPARIRNSTNYDPTYDSTNYSALGRLVSFSFSKHF